MFKVTILAIFILSVLCSHKTEETYEIELVIFSGSPNPVFSISITDYIKLNLNMSNTHKPKQNAKVMGYKGLRIKHLNSHIIAEPYAELYFLNLIKDQISIEIYNHINQRILTEYEFGIKQKHENIFNEECEGPIVGPDTVPDFNPKVDDNGCFITRKWENNCYNYSTDVLTNTFAQPGRGTGHKWKANTCDDVKRASLSDGLEWVGTEYPSNIDKGHFVALLIWPNTNFHWIRLDSNGKWSHKPGATPVTNKDNEDNLITDPSKQDFAPWTKFCGYFKVIPSLIKIN
jgi:hypothetical protein